MRLMLLGAMAMACITISLFFLRFWKTTKDRFFLFFSVSFCIEACCRIILGLVHYSSEQEPLIYLLRLLALLLIIVAIVDKNRRKSRE